MRRPPDHLAPPAGRGQQLDVGLPADKPTLHTYQDELDLKELTSDDDSMASVRFQPRSL